MSTVSKFLSFFCRVLIASTFALFTIFYSSFAVAQSCNTVLGKAAEEFSLEIKSVSPGAKTKFLFKGEPHELVFLGRQESSAKFFEISTGEYFLIPVSELHPRAQKKILELPSIARQCGPTCAANSIVNSLAYHQSRGGKLKESARALLSNRENAVNFFDRFSYAGTKQAERVKGSFEAAGVKARDAYTTSKLVSELINRNPIFIGVTVKLQGGKVHEVIRGYEVVEREHFLVPTYEEDVSAEGNHAVVVVGTFLGKRRSGRLFPQRYLIVADSAIGGLEVWTISDLEKSGFFGLGIRK